MAIASLNISVSMKWNPLFDGIMEQAQINGITEATIKLQQYVNQNCPVDTTQLINSLKRYINKKKLEGEVSANTPYAYFVETGDERGAKAKRTGEIPFMRPALNNNADEYREIMGDFMKRALGT